MQPLRSYIFCWTAIAFAYWERGAQIKDRPSVPQFTQGPMTGWWKVYGYSNTTFP
jgi:hypothetical protein